MAVSARQRRLAKAIDEDKKSVEAAGSVSLRRFAVRLHMDLMKAFRRGEALTPILHDSWEKLSHILNSAMVAGHLRGKIRSLTTLQEARPKALAQDEDEDGFGEAVRFAQARMNMTDTELERIQEIYGESAVRATTQYGNYAEKEVQGVIAEIVSKNMHVREASLLLGNKLEALGISADDRKAHTLETVVRTQIQLSYMAGRMAVNADPAIQEILWGYLYVTVGDDRVRPEHAALDGVQLPKEDPFWTENMPPNGYNCRCSVIEVFNNEEPKEVQPPEEAEVDGTVISPGADEGWKFNPGDLFQDVTTSVPPVESEPGQVSALPKIEGLDPELEEERLRLAKERMKWRKLANEGVPGAREKQLELQAKIDAINEKLAAIRKARKEGRLDPMSTRVTAEPAKAAKKLRSERLGETDPYERNKWGQLRPDLPIDKRLMVYREGDAKIQAVLDKANKTEVRPFEMAPEVVQEKLDELSRLRARLEELEARVAAGHPIDYTAVIEQKKYEIKRLERQLEKIGKDFEQHVLSPKQRIEVAHEALKRPEGTKPVVMGAIFNENTVPSSTARENLKDAKKWLEERFVGATARDEFIVAPKQRIGGDSRAYYDEVNKQMNVDHAERLRTCIHEFCHGIEYNTVGVHDAVAEFQRYRHGSETPVRFNHVPELAGYNYRPDEKGCKDKWDLAFPKEEAWYVGKIYPHSATEVLSMGVERMYVDPVGFMEKDPEYAKFIMGIMDGSLRKGNASYMNRNRNEWTDRDLEQ